MKSVLLIGPTPPPHHGLAIFTSMALKSVHLAERYRVLHLDTADRRGLGNMGRFEAGNIMFALRHGARLFRMIVRERPDVVYLPIAQNTWGTVRDAWLLLIARLTGCRIATHLHGSDLGRFYAEAPGWVRWVLRQSTGWTDAAGVLGDGLRSVFDGLVDPERVHVAAPWIEDPFPHGPPVRVDGGDVTVAYIGMLYRPKGFLDLIDAVAGVEGVRLVLAGGWFSADEQAEAEEAVRRHGIADRVTFPGRVSEERKRELLAEADIFVFPGYQPEGLPLVVLEAMAAGLPVVATPMGTIPDAIRDDVEGVLVAPRDVSAMTAAVGRLASDAALRKRMGSAARRRFEAAFSEERAIAGLSALLDAAAGHSEQTVVLTGATS